jgi:hypothetical protein
MPLEGDNATSGQEDAVLGNEAVQEPSKREAVQIHEEVTESHEETTMEEDEPDMVREQSLPEGDDPPVAEPDTAVLDESVYASLNDPSESEQNAPDTPLPQPVRTPEPLREIHALGDLHGWAPGLIAYLVHHGLAEISIDGTSMGHKGNLNSQALQDAFARRFTDHGNRLPHAGLRGRPLFEAVVNGNGHGSVRARWTGGEGTGFVQVGDVFDRADHSELAAEILRQLIIHAPGQVHVLVGNHEQFMLEEEFQNWHMNEARNAVADHRDGPEEWVGRHLRFLSTMETDTTDRTLAVFRAYTQSTRLLYLTQAAVHRTCLGIENGLTDEESKALLAHGWGPYRAVDRIWERLSSEESIPGAMVALTIGDTLFHHAEPDRKALSTLHGNLLQGPGFEYVDYLNGNGDLSASAHSPLLWARGAASGSASGAPKAESTLEESAHIWPGLYRVVHGHTPTTSVPDFDAVQGPLRSTTVSYAAQPNSLPQPGVASEIRVFDIDEGMSPVYYEDGPRDDPLRIPTGMRVTQSRPGRTLEAVIRHTDNEHVLHIKEGRSLYQDTRKLWRWQDGQQRTHSPDEPSTDGRQSFVKTIEGAHWLLKADKRGVETLNRHISGFSIPKNVLYRCLGEMESIPRGWKHDGEKPVATRIHGLTDLFKEQGGQKSAVELGLVGVYLQIQQHGTHKLWALNATRHDQTVHLVSLNDNDETRFEEFILPKMSTTTGSIHQEHAMMACSYGSKEHVSNLMRFWRTGGSMPSLDEAFVAVRQATSNEGKHQLASNLFAIEKIRIEREIQRIKREEQLEEERKLAAEKEKQTLEDERRRKEATRLRKEAEEREAESARQRQTTAHQTSRATTTATPSPDIRDAPPPVGAADVRDQVARIEPPAPRAPPTASSGQMDGPQREEHATPADIEPVANETHTERALWEDEGVHVIKHSRMAAGFTGYIKRKARKLLGSEVNGKEVMYEFSVTREWLVQNKCLTTAKLPSLGRIKFKHGKGHGRLWFELYDLSGKFLGEDDREPAKDDFTPTKNGLIIKDRSAPSTKFLKNMNLGSHTTQYKKIFESEKFNQLLYQIIFELET